MCSSLNRSTQRATIDWLKQMLLGQVVINDEGKEVAILERIEKDGVVPRYVNRAKTWTTVTPVALPGSDEGKANKTDKLLEKMFRHAGYSMDDVEKIDLRPDGGNRPSGAFCMVLPRAIAGPFCLGHSCHFGLGLFVPGNEKEAVMP